MKKPQDHDVRRRLLTELDTSFVVEAAAGTGKTTVLVSRIVAVVRSGKASLRQVIAVTFTDRAAGEMKLRLREALEEARSAATAAQAGHLTRALEELEVARIGTIHGLCADILRDHPVEARVDPLFEVVETREAAALRLSVFNAWFERVLSKPGEGVRRLLRRRPKSPNEDTPRQALLDAVTKLIEHRDFTADWRREPFGRDAAIDALLLRLAELGALADKSDKPKAKAKFLKLLREVHRFVADVLHRETVAARDHDGLEAGLAELAKLWEWKDAPPDWILFQGKRPEEVAALRDDALGALTAFVQRSDADLAACLQRELRPVVGLYEAEKAQLGKLDFVDLLLRTRDLVLGNGEVRRSLQDRATHLFVDEFQDTDPLQAELLLLLAADDPAVTDPFAVRPVPGKLFVVGDPKQAVYRFRRADIVLYEQVKTHLRSHGAQVVHLSTSFRGTPGIQTAVNGAFDVAMGGGNQAQYVALQPWRDSHPDQPSIVALSVPKPFATSGYITKAAVEESVPNVVAGFVEYLVTRSGWKVLEDGKPVPVKPRHVCILFRRFQYWGTDVSRRYARALEARHVPHVLVGGRSFHVREEVMALRTALWAIERPDNELSVYATLKGPFFGLSDDALLAFRAEDGRLHPLKPREVEKLSPVACEVAQSLEILRDLHLKRNRQSVGTTVTELLEKVRAFAGVAFWKAGDQALANLLQLAEMSARFEKGATSFRDVVESLEEEADEGDAGEAPLVEEGTEGVRMMTAHAAKGLEFPVVILAEPTANVARQQPSHWVDAKQRLWAQALAGCAPAELRDHEEEVLALDREEAVRLTYVAATRARDVLVVPAVADKKFPDTWTEVLYPSIYPQLGSEQLASPAPGCPPFGTDCVVDRQGPQPSDSPVPGLHRASTGKNGVVWWDPGTLNLEVEEAGGLERNSALAPGDEAAAAKTLAAWDGWRAERLRLIATGSKPSVEVRTARDLTAPARPGVVTVDQSLKRQAGRPHGRRFGALVHAILAQVPYDATKKQVKAVAELEARGLLATPEEEAAAVKAVEGALGHALLRQAAKLAPAAVRREANVVNMLADGSYLEGTVDLAFDAGAEWVVVEFKTDEELGVHRAAYEAQTEAYVDAIAAATGKATRGVVLIV